MAIWQLRLLLAPRAAVLARYTIMPATIPSDDAYDVRWWTAVQPPAGFEAELSRLLPEVTSWSPNSRMWGDTNRDDAHVSYDEASRAVEEVGFRLDLREPNLALQQGLCAFAARLDCLVLLLGQARLVSPTPEALAAGVAGSQAQKFVRDPAGTLTAIAREGPDTTKS